MRYTYQSVFIQVIQEVTGWSRHRCQQLVRDFKRRRLESIKQWQARLTAAEAEALARQLRRKRGGMLAWLKDLTAPEHKS